MMISIGVGDTGKMLTRNGISVLAQKNNIIFSPQSLTPGHKKHLRFLQKNKKKVKKI